MKGIIGSVSSTSISRPADRKELAARIDRLAVLLFVISLGVRLAFAVPVIVHDVLPIGDEGTYLEIADGYDAIFRAIRTGTAIKPEYIEEAYHEGEKVPLYPLILGVIHTLFGSSPEGPRLAGVVISAATTPLVYLLTKRLSTRKAALIAATFHIIYFSFIAFSHYLWPATLFIPFLLLVAYFTIQLENAERSNEGLRYAVLAGVALGLAALTQSRALPLLLLIPAWVLWRVKRTRSRILLPIVIIVAYSLILSPWESVVLRREGRFVALSTLGGAGLYWGNNPWLQSGYSSCYADSACRGEMNRAARKYSKANNVTLDVARRELALEEIRGDPVLFLERAFARARHLWTLDTFPFRFFLRAVYPPVSNTLLAALWFVALATYLILFASAVLGFSIPSPPLPGRALLVFIILVNMGLPMISGATTRFNIPNIALLLPAAGHGLAHLKETQFRHKLLAAGLVIALCVSIFTTVPEVVTKMYASSHYAPVIHRANTLLGIRASVIDRIEFRAANSKEGDEITFSTLDDSYRFKQGGTSQFIWEVPPGGQNLELVLVVYSYDALQPTEIEIVSAQTGESVTLTLVDRSAWQQWQPTGLEGITYRWNNDHRLTPLPEE